VFIDTFDGPVKIEIRDLHASEIAPFLLTLQPQAPGPQ
jgi:hypothetical protein